MIRIFQLPLLAVLVASSPALAELPDPIREADYRQVDPAEAALGQLLFYDPILSGNRNISCASCHHPRFGTSDGLSLGLGEGGVGLGPARRADPDNPPEQRIPRNAPALFNLGAHEFTVLFHDGRIEVDPSRPSGLRTPLGPEMEAGFATLLSAQTMFPVLSPDEMAGHYQENPVAKAVRQGRLTGPGGAWDLIAARVSNVPAYATAFAELEPEIADGRAIHFTDISDAVAAFMELEWRSDTSPFDAYLKGDGAALTEPAQKGLSLFYGPAGCGECHAGPFLTDHRFHAMGQPQLGPGKAARFETHRRDVGRMRVTGRVEDSFAFRTPSLRNVVHTGPWGHAGAFDDLRSFLHHHIDPVAGLAEYEPQTVLPRLPEAGDDWVLRAGGTQGDWEEIAASITRAPVVLTDTEIEEVLAFLEALSDPIALKGRLGVPETVPSGLPVDQ